MFGGIGMREEQEIYQKKNGKRLKEESRGRPVIV